jgi:hypothetical protein
MIFKVVGVSPRALLTVLALTLVDFALWHWSLAGDRGTMGLISGLTLPPLFALLVWLAVVNLGRLLAHGARRPAARLKRETTRVVRRHSAKGAPILDVLANDAAEAPRVRASAHEDERRRKVAA